MSHKIEMYKECGGVPIYRDYNVVDGQQVYIGNGQGCDTLWFKSVKEARRFIRTFRDKMVVTDLGIVQGLIPKSICNKCRCHYSFGTKEWEKYKDFACEEYKEELKTKAEG